MKNKPPANRAVRISKIEKLLKVKCKTCGEKPSVEIFKGEPICYFCLNDFSRPTLQVKRQSSGALWEDA